MIKTNLRDRCLPVRIRELLRAQLVVVFPCSLKLIQECTIGDTHFAANRKGFFVGRRLCHDFANFHTSHPECTAVYL